MPVTFHAVNIGMDCRRRRFMPRASAQTVASDNSCRVTIHAVTTFEVFLSLSAAFLILDSVKMILKFRIIDRQHIIHNSLDMMAAFYRWKAMSEWTLLPTNMKIWHCPQEEVTIWTQGKTCTYDLLEIVSPNTKWTKSRKYRGMFEVNSPGKKYKFGKRIGLNK